ncbi:MAG: hypothetical protein LBM28_04540 [Oscillospiraceae bacterium]|nr:hypothetical protein [Oscillospiraceae bacterium]
MKKRFLLLVVVLLVFLSSCTGEKPEDMSEEMYNIGLAALETVDEYFDGIITLEEARYRLEGSEDAADRLYDKARKQSGGAIYGTEVEDDFFVSSCITSIDFHLMMKSYGTGTNEDILEYRNDLADALNESKR